MEKNRKTTRSAGRPAIGGEKERIKRAYAAPGQRSQKMFNFRLDLENLDWLNQQQNKGRYINELISKDRLGK